MSPTFQKSTEGRALKPIAFSDVLVRALLREENPKTRTRRLLPRLGWTVWDGEKDGQGWPIGMRRAVLGSGTKRVNGAALADRVERYPCRYGEPGTLLYVQEPLVPHEVNKSGSRRLTVYRATAELVLVDGEPLPWRWQVNALAPRYCPAEAARLRLENTLVRGEWLQEITEEEAVAEGLTAEHSIMAGLRWLPGRYLSPVSAFHDLWDSIHTAPGERWEDDPGVLVLGVARWERRAAGARVDGGR